MLETDSLGARILQQMKNHEEARRDYETGLWIDIARFVNPRRENIGQDTWTLTKGQRRGRDAYDGTPLSALNTWADGMQGFLVAESLNWFQSEMDNPFLNDIPEVRQWLQDYDMAMYSAFRRSNFYAVLGEWFRDAGSVGTATLYTEEDIIKRCCSHICIHPREVFIAENKFGEVDTIFRKFELTARQAVQKFDYYKRLGDDNTSLIVRNSKEHPEKRHLFIHAAFPNDDQWYADKITNKNYCSVYVEAEASGDKQIGNVVRKGGYDISPYAVWRFRKNSDEIYGYSPAADALVEVFSLNQIGNTMLKAAHKSVEPPMNIPEELRGNVRMTPDGYNYYQDPKRVITPIMTGINFPIGIDREERLQKSIEDKYRVEFFLVLARAEREMTAYEIQERQAEKAVLMGPQVDRLTTEGLKKVFDVVSDIEDKAGRLPPVPDIILEIGGLININFTGPLAQAQKRLFTIQPIRNAVNELAPMATIYPEVLYRFNADEAAEQLLKATGVSQRFIRSDAEVEELKAQAAQRQQQKEMLEQVGAAAEAVPKLSKEVEAGSPLAALTEGV